MYHLRLRMRVVLTQQVWVQGQYWSQVRRGLGNDEADQVGVEAGQGEQRSSHHSSHGVAHKCHALRRVLQMLASREREKTDCSILT